MGFEYKEELKELLPKYMELLEDRGIVEDRGGGYWTCPFCGSGNGERGTAAFHIIGEKYHCFACNEGGDIFDLVRHIEKLSPYWKEHYNRTLKIMRPYLDGQAVTTSTDKEVVQPLEKVDYRDYLVSCHANVEKTDYFSKRGLSKEIVERFRCGYDPAKNLITIPYSPECSGYVHRVLWEADNKYCKHGNEIFNLNALYTGDNKAVFVVEGQIDAMSIETVGCSAVGIGGTNEIGKLVEQLGKEPSSKTLILALDNDKAGRKATGKLIEAIADADLEQRFVVNSNLYGQYKDANEFLVAEREDFTKKIRCEMEKCQ